MIKIIYFNRMKGVLYCINFFMYKNILPSSDNKRGSLWLDSDFNFKIKLMKMDENVNKRYVISWMESSL